MSFENLTNDNIMIFAMKAYDKPNCIMSEFKEDMKRFNYLKRLFKRYRKLGELREQLVLNHLVVLYNVFGPEATARILFYKTDERDYDILKTFLDYLDIMPDFVYGINGKTISSSDLPLDMNVAEILRNI